MLFKDMKPGYPVYLLNKKDGIRAIQGKVVKVSEPYFPSVQPGQMPTMNTTQRVVDVTLEAEGITNTYSIPETLTVTYAANSLVLSTDREGILRDVESIKTRDEEELRMQKKREEEIAACEKILEEWNPAFAEKKEQEKRLLNLEDKMGNIEGMLRKLISQTSSPQTKA